MPAQAEGGVTPTDAQLAALAALAMAATPGPWREDDCNVFCGPMADARTDAIMAKIEGRPYDRGHLRLDAFVATTEQRGEHSDADARYIAAASPDVVLALLAERERLRASVEELAGHLDTAVEVIEGAGIADEEEHDDARAVIHAARAALGEE